MTILEDLLGAFGTSQLNDLYVTGYIDDGTSIYREILPRGGARQFHPMWNEVYIQVGERLFRYRAIDQYSRLRVEPADRIECSFAFDPDDTFGVMSIVRLSLQSGRKSALIDRIELFVDQECEPEACVVAAMGLVTTEGEYLFFDPLDFNGIHVGGLQSRDLWMAHFGSGHRSEWRSVRGAGAA